MPFFLPKQLSGKEQIACLLLGSYYVTTLQPTSKRRRTLMDVLFLQQFLNLLTFGLWGKLGRLTHYAVDAVLISTILAGMRRSTGLTFNTERVTVGGDKDANKWIDKYLGVGEWVMDQSVAIAGSSGWFQRTR
ncbi:hypothetical protein F4819DRAFT_483752 [Hypoxylon fuscum]|nr:hypothetical protein F4819DRAFT_483752 [Hypoxylon fuscum]